MSIRDQALSTKHRVPLYPIPPRSLAATMERDRGLLGYQCMVHLADTEVCLEREQVGHRPG